MQSSDSDLELFVYKKQMSQNSLGLIMSMCDLKFKITTISEESEMSSLKKRMTETCSKKTGASCCVGQCQMLPALIDSSRSEVICGPEGIITYICLVASKKSELLRGTCPEEEVRINEIRSCLITFCFSAMGISGPVTKETMSPLIKESVSAGPMSRIESILSDSRNTVVGTKDYTLIDIMVYDFVKIFEIISPGSTASLSKCTALVSRMESVPSISSWTSRPEFMKGVDSFTPDLCLYVWGMNIKSA